jgi:nitrilase
MKVAIAQRSPAFLDRGRTIERVIESIYEAHALGVGDRSQSGGGAGLIAFGEAFVPGYPFWLDRIDAARFEAPDVKDLQGAYVNAGVDIERGDLAAVQAAARETNIAIVLGVVERAAERGRHSLFCSRVFITADGAIASVHRKLVPTYEERLSWASGDGHGLRVHDVGPFIVGALNCWENWMPLARASLHAQGENLHVAIWPGAERNTRNITPIIAFEARSFVVSAGATAFERDVPAGLPMRDRMCEPGETIKDGGSCIAGPNGEWIVEPVVGREELIVADLDPATVRAERTTFDMSGHYARPDVLRLSVNRERHPAARFIDNGPEATEGDRAAGLSDDSR